MDMETYLLCAKHSSHLIPMTILWSKYYYYPHLTEWTLRHQEIRYVSKVVHLAWPPASGQGEIQTQVARLSRIHTYPDPRSTASKR